MEEDATIQAQACKFPSIQTNNIASNNNKTTSEEVNNNGEVRKRSSEGWQHNSSRIIRVSRASGGKDRHSKVMTSKGLRDRRVRLSVTTAIQFYDLQDRLGYDQPSKAVEWLIKAASDAISDLPSLNTNFPETPKQQATDDKRGHVKCITMGGNEDGEASLNFQVVNNQSQNLSLSKSACSSTSETSKGSGSGLSLSRSEIRVKARERARERTTKEKEKHNDEPCCNNNNIVQHNSNNINSDVVMSIAQSSSSFTELLTGVPAASSPTGQHQHQHHHHRSDEVDVFNKSTRQHHQWGLGVAPMDYFNTSNQFSGQMLLGNSVAHHHHQGMSVAQFGVIHGESNNNHHHHQHQHHQSDQLQHFSFLPDHFGGGGGSSEYNLNFSISSSSCNDNNNSRGTLQSNLSPSFLLPQLQLQRLSTSPLDGSSNFPFFIAPPAAVENHHHHQHHQQHQEFSPELDGGLQLCYGDGSRLSDHKGKGKN